MKTNVEDILSKYPNHVNVKQIADHHQGHRVEGFDFTPVSSIVLMLKDLNPRQATGHDCLPPKPVKAGYECLPPKPVKAGYDCVPPKFVKASTECIALLLIAYFFD